MKSKMRYSYIHCMHSKIFIRIEEQVKPYQVGQLRVCACALGALAIELTATFQGQL